MIKVGIKRDICHGLRARNGLDQGIQRVERWIQAAALYRYQMREIEDQAFQMQSRRVK